MWGQPAIGANIWSAAGKAVAPPPDILLPENPAERAAWRLWIAQGWEEGYKQADEIFQSDLNRLIADFEGMVPLPRPARAEQDYGTLCNDG